MQCSSREVTVLLRQWSRRDTEVFDWLVSLVYPKLRRLTVGHGWREHISNSVRELCVEQLYPPKTIRRIASNSIAFALASCA